MFNLKRTYLDFRKDVAENLSFRVTSDVGRTETENRLILYLKHGFLTWNTHHGIFQIGLQPTNYFGPTKLTWGYRFIEKFSTDRAGFGATADLGLSIQREIFQKLLFHLAVYNGGGYKKTENDSYKRTTLLISYGERKLNKKPGWNAGSIISYEPYESDLICTKTKKEIKTTVTSFAGYALTYFRIGGEYSLVQNSADIDQTVLAIYSSYQLTESVNLLFRCDRSDLSTQNIANQETYLLAGINIHPQTGFSIAPNVRYIFEGDSEESILVLMLNFEFKF